jgi:AraC family transcriptional regulator
VALNLRGNDFDRPSRVLFETPLVQVGQFRCPTGHPMFADSGPTRVHCFVFPRTAVWIQHEGGAPFVADPTTVPLYNPGRPYRRRAISADGDRTDWFGISADALREAVAAHDPRAADAGDRLFRRDVAHAGAATFLAQRRVFQHVRAEPSPDALPVEEAVLAILDDVLASTADDSSSAPPLPQSRRRALTEDVRAQLNRSFTRRDDLTVIARSVGASVFHVCRTFKHQTGRTMHAYRSELRLRQSLEWLRDGGDVLQVALALGYSSHSHFTAAFHRTFRVTPSQFRRRPAQQRLTRTGERRGRARS